MWTAIDYCEYSAPFKKPTAFAGTLPGLDKLGRLCTHSAHGEQLRGQVLYEGKWVWKTSLAAAYPPALAHLYADIVLEAAPGGAQGPAGLIETGLCSALCDAADTKVPEDLKLRPLPRRFMLPWQNCACRLGA